MINPESARQAEPSALVPGQADTLCGEIDQPMLRIRRIGKRLFNVADCIITFGSKASPGSTDGEGLRESVETDFCYSVPLTNEPVVMTDIRHHSELGRHPAVSGAPGLRFYASHPVYSSGNELAGRIHLVDPMPWLVFQESDHQALADLAGLVERELQLRWMNASQLDLQKKNKNLRRKSLIDPLIGTWNRGAIMRLLTIEAIRCDKAGVPLSLIVADLDHFKKINDTYGHPAGDTVLVKAASRMRSCIRHQEALGRYGGEEFLIVLPGSSSATAMMVAERMRQAVASQPVAIGSAVLNLTMSAGVASTDMFPNATTEELISHADMALYAAKDAGRNRVSMAAPNLS